MPRLSKKKIPEKCVDFEWCVFGWKLNSKNGFKVGNLVLFFVILFHFIDLVITTEWCRWVEQFFSFLNVNDWKEDYIFCVGYLFLLQDINWDGSMNKEITKKHFHFTKNSNKITRAERFFKMLNVICLSEIDILSISVTI